MPQSPEAFLPLSGDHFAILVALAHRSLHGYGIMQQAEQRSGGHVRLQTGALYRALKHLLRDDLIDECAAPKDEPSHDERRRYYKLTGLGERVLAAEAERMAALVREARAVQQSKKPRFA